MADIVKTISEPVAGTAGFRVIIDRRRTAGVNQFQITVEYQPPGDLPIGATWDPATESAAFKQAVSDALAQIIPSAKTRMGF